MRDFSKLESVSVFDEWQRLRQTSKRSISRASAFAKEIGLEDALAGMSLLGVVGSKGKGTAAVYASAALAASGSTVGTITSPGVTSNRDRVRINGKVFTDTQYQAMLERIIEARGHLKAPSVKSGYLSPSGLFTLAGLLTIAEAGCSVAVVEAGIGGRSDELSLLPLDGLIVTEIFNEHADVLGPTVVDIAKNKLGVVSNRTKFVVSLPQSAAVKEVVERSCEEHQTDLILVDGATILSPEIPYPPGLNRLNAIAGVRAGCRLGEIISGFAPTIDVLRGVVSSVSYPGRLSTHMVGEHQVVVDSAISRSGLATALMYARSYFGREPDTVFVSVPRNKDFDGFIEELRGVAARKVFVNMAQSHLPFPTKGEWPWDWIELVDIRDALSAGEALVVGTATFSAEILQMLNAQVESIFDPCGTTSA
jgi:dihydrofolate synthase/folylpolyglutamate synthase